MTKLDQYSNIQPLVQKDAEDIARKVYTEMSAQFSVPTTSYHIHNNVDSPTLPGSSLIPFQAISSANGGVMGYVLSNGQEYSYMGKTYTQPVYSPIYFAPLTIIQGIVGGADSFIGGNAPLGTLMAFFTAETFFELWLRIDATQNVTLTGGLAGGATSATLDAAWPSPTAVQSTTFSNGNVRNVQFTFGSTAITWSGGLSGAATATIVTACKWKGVSLDLSR